MSGWLSNITSFVDNTFDNALKQLNSAQDEIENERSKFANTVANEKVSSSVITQLPWEANEGDEHLEILCNDAKERILSLSVIEENFTVMPKLLINNEIETKYNEEIIKLNLKLKFNFSDFIPVALKLLTVDPNLARMHAKLMPRMDEEIFWSNYSNCVNILK